MCFESVNLFYPNVINLGEKGFCGGRGLLKAPAVQALVQSHVSV